MDVLLEGAHFAHHQRRLGLFVKTRRFQSPPETKMCRNVFLVELGCMTIVTHRLDVLALGSEQEDLGLELETEEKAA